MSMQVRAQLKIACHWSLITCDNSSNRNASYYHSEVNVVSIICHMHVHTILTLVNDMKDEGNQKITTATFRDK